MTVKDSDTKRIIRRGPYPELTVTAVVVGYILGILITLSIGYASLILGFSIEGSELAAILGFGVLRGILGRNSIVENNINQTIASAVNGASAGMMFTVPALFILGQTDFNAVLMVFSCIAGGILGIAGDNMQDLKAGYIVKATPWKQQVMQIVGTVSAALVMAPVLTLLFKAYGFAGHSSATDNALIAPQANLIASVARGVFQGGLPWNYVFVGMVTAIGVIAADSYLARTGSAFRMPVLAVAIGIYLPFELEVPIFAGGLIHQVIKVYHQRRATAKETLEVSNRHGLLFASGLITGEALIGIMLAVPIVISGRTDVMAIVKKPLGAWPGIILLTGIAYWLYRTAVGKAKK